MITNARRILQKAWLYEHISKPVYPGAFPEPKNPLICKALCIANNRTPVWVVFEFHRRIFNQFMLYIGLGRSATLKILLSNSQRHAIWISSIIYIFFLKKVILPSTDVAYLKFF